MSWRPRDALKSEFEHVHRFDVANRPEALPGVAPDPLVHLRDFVVRQARVRLGDGDKLSLVPDTERVVGQQARPSSAARLRIDQHGINRVRIDLPFPPVSAAPPYAVDRRAAL